MRRNWLEWLILVVSVVAIVGLVGYLAIQSVSGDAPADISVAARPAEARTTGVGWELPVTVRNAGASPASTIAIEASATVEGEEETSDIMLDLLAPGSEVELVVGFSAAPEGEVMFRLIGYESP
jgi:uncharacterized protein (TIGR02588 family)